MFYGFIEYRASRAVKRYFIFPVVDQIVVIIFTLSSAELRP